MRPRKPEMIAPKPPNEEHRLAILREYQILDTGPEPGFDRIVDLAARLLKAPRAYVSLVDEDRLWFKARCGSEAWEAPRNGAICSYAILSEEPLVVSDTACDERFLAHAEDGLRFYAGVPLVSPRSATLGTLCVVGGEPRTLSPDELLTLTELASMVVDLLELRLASKQLRDSRNFLDSVLDNIPHMVFLKDADDLRFAFFNKAGEELIGVGRTDLLGKNDFDFFPQEQAEAFTARDREVLSRQELTNIEREPIMTQFKGERLLHTKKIPMRDESGQARFLLGISEDITEKVNAEHQLELALKDAELANQAKSMFLSRMSHELRTPLNAILGFGQLLGLDALTGPQRESVEQIVKAGKHLLGLINEVLEISRIEAGTISVSKEAIPLIEVVESAVRMIEPLAANANVRVEKEWDARALGFALSDKQRLAQVLINLLSNAIKYNRVGGKVTVRCRKAGSKYRIEIQDTGPGIQPAMLPRLFVPFDRLGAECSHVEGLGLGLALSKRLAETMGGDLGLAETGAAGSMFYVEIPSTEAPQMPETSQAVSDPEPTCRTVKTILYIEDNKSNTSLMNGIMRIRPWLRLVTAENGREGIRAAQEVQPDLVLLDLHLPDMDGKRVLHELRSDPATAHIPVIIASADANPEQERALAVAGAAGYLTKPLDIGALFQAMDAELYGGERLSA